MRLVSISSILTPWVTVRKVKVDVEVVRLTDSGSPTCFDGSGSPRQI